MPMNVKKLEVNIGMSRYRILTDMKDIKISDIGFFLN